MSPPRRPSRIAVRGPVSLGAGAAVAVGTGILLDPVAGLLAGWAAVAIVNVVWMLRTIWPMDAAQTRAHATTDDPARPVARLVALAGSLASLGGVVAVLVRSGDPDIGRAFAVAGVALCAVVSSWTLIQLDYALRYADVFYSRRARGLDGGIDFNQREEPMYTDFGYFSVGLGMSYQVSDNNISANEIRRIVIAQTLIAYLFGAVILAGVINLVAGMG